MNDEGAASVTESKGRAGEGITGDVNSSDETALGTREDTNEPKRQNPRELENARYATLTSRAHSDEARSLVDIVTGMVVSSPHWVVQAQC